VASLGHLLLPIDHEDWQRIVSAATGLLAHNHEPAKLATSVIWAASVYGRLGEASTVDFIRALHATLEEQSRSAFDSSRGHMHLAMMLRQASFEGAMHHIRPLTLPPFHHAGDLQPGRTGQQRCP
jgi:hypothetical protein